MRPWAMLADRTAVLFLGVAAGAAIGLSFAYGGQPVPDIAGADTAPPPPAARQPSAASIQLPAKTTPALECAVPFQQQILATVEQDRPVRVGVFGDSFGDGLWSALYHQLPAKARYEVVKYSQQSTGFTRYGSLNLETHTAQQIAADGPVDIAVISFGANDTQGVLADGKAAALLTPRWKEIVGARIDRLVRLLRAKGAMVYWVGLPKMRKESFDADIAQMNAFYAERMERLGVPFIATAPLSVDQAGAYAAYLPDGPDGKKTLMRANDGIHMSMQGYIHITRGLAERIRAYVAAAREIASGGRAEGAA